jgi:hypothetical protein
MWDGVEINKRLMQLKSAHLRTRELAAEELADFLEAGLLNKNEFRRVVRTLVGTALAETDPDVKESMFNALSSASMAPTVSSVNWDPIASSLDSLDPACLEHAFVILGFSGDTKYRTKIKRYLTHPDETIRLEAADALSQLNPVKKPKPKPRKQAEKNR